MTDLFAKHFIWNFMFYSCKRTRSTVCLRINLSNSNLFIHRIQFNPLPTFHKLSEGQGFSWQDWTKAAGCVVFSEIVAALWTRGAFFRFRQVDFMSGDVSRHEAGDQHIVVCSIVAYIFILYSYIWKHVQFAHGLRRLVLIRYQVPRFPHRKCWSG